MSNPNRPGDGTAVSIKADDEVAKGRFANLAQVGSSRETFVLDFAFMQGKQGWLLSRILLSPQHAKRFMIALSETIAKHEEQHGKIDPGHTLQ